jgi:hypothetical protein
MAFTTGCYISSEYKEPRVVTKQCQYNAFQRALKVLCKIIAGIDECHISSKGFRNAYATGVYDVEHADVQHYHQQAGWVPKSKVPRNHYDKSVLTYKAPPRPDYTIEEAIGMIPLICRLPKRLGSSPKKTINGTKLKEIISKNSPAKKRLRLAKKIISV